MGTADSIDEVPEGAVVLIDESYLQHHARASMAEAGRNIGNLINLSRQRNQTLLFIGQAGRQLDINIISQADVIAIKELSELSREFERPQLRRLTDNARLAFALISGDKRKMTWVYSQTANHEGLVKNESPSFWTSNLGHAYAQETRSSNQSPRLGKRLTREETKTVVKRMHEAEFSYDYIANSLGISKTQAWNLVNEL